MPYKLKGNCVYKGKTKIGCSKTRKEAERYIATLRKKHENKILEKTVKEIRDYFSSREDGDFMRYDNHKFSSVECLMDPDCEAPWDQDYIKYIKENRK